MPQPASPGADHLHSASETDLLPGSTGTDARDDEIDIESQNDAADRLNPRQHHTYDTKVSKQLPDSIKRRRPSLSTVLNADPNEDPDHYQQQLAAKVRQAAATLEHDGQTAGGKIEGHKHGNGHGNFHECDDYAAQHTVERFHMLMLPIFTIISFCACTAMYVKQRDFTEGMVGSEMALRDASSPEQFTTHYALNEPIGAFVGVVSIIFALMYTSVYNEGLMRQSAIRNSLALEAGGVHTAMLLVRTLDADDMVNKTRALLLFSSYVESLAAEIRYKGRSPPSDLLHSSIEALYAAVPFLANVASDGEGDEMDRVLIQRTVDALNRVCEARHTRTSEERNEISLFTFFFLTSLAVFTFFGVLFLQVGSLALTHAIVLMTALALFTAMCVLVDVAMPWRGLIRVDTGIFTSIRKEISLVLNQGENEINLMGRRGSLEAERIGARSVSPERWNARNAMPLDPKALEPQPPSHLRSTSVGLNHHKHLQAVLQRRGVLQCSLVLCAQRT